MEVKFDWELLLKLHSEMRVSKVQKCKFFDVSSFCWHEVIAGESAKMGQQGKQAHL